MTVFVQNLLQQMVSCIGSRSWQVWNLETRSLICSLQWESNITAFSVISGSHFIYIGDEHDLFSVIKFDAEKGQLLKSSNHLSAKFLREAVGFPESSDQPIVGILPQPYSSGNILLIAFQDELLILWDVSEAKIVFLGGGKDLELKDEAGNTSEMDTNLPADILEQNLGDKEISALCWASSDGSILAFGYLDGDILFWNLSSAASSKGQCRGAKNTRALARPEVPLIRQKSRHRTLFILKKNGKISRKPVDNEKVKETGHRNQIRVRESVMRGEGISTPHIHRTRWDPFV